MKRNDGFSYVEMLLVLAIIAIMIGFVTVSIGIVNRNNVARTSEKMESLAHAARTSALTKGGSWLNIASVDGKIYAYIGESLDKQPNEVKKKGEKICNNDLVITVSGSYGGTTSDTVEEEGVQSAKVLRIYFKQSTGSPSSETTIIVQKKNNNLKQSSFHIDNVTGKISK